MKTSDKTQSKNDNIMSENIINNLDNPRQLEQLYRDNQSNFKKSFREIYPAIQHKTSAQIWHERLTFDDAEISWGTNKDLIFVIVASLIAGLLAKLPEFLTINEEYFYPRNIGFIVFPFLAAYFAWKQQLQSGKIITVGAAMIISAIYINFLPDSQYSDTLILACIHLPLFLWALLGFTFAGDGFNDYQKRLDFLRYNGDLLVMTAIMLISGGALTAVSFGLFDLIGINIEEVFSKYVVVFGMAAVPILGTYLVRTNPHLVNKVSPVIARVFTPLVLVTLVIYLGAVIYTGKDPYTDREFLMIFNVMLIGVMAIILFSVAELSKNVNSKLGLALLFALSIVTIIVNGIALSAILFRIAEWGITPNRLAVLGGNVLILINLLIVSHKIFRALKNQNEIVYIEERIAAYLPVYAVWTVIVIFIFPLIFSFK